MARDRSDAFSERSYTSNRTANQVAEPSRTIGGGVKLSIPRGKTSLLTGDPPSALSGDTMIRIADSIEYGRPSDADVRV